MDFEQAIQRQRDALLRLLAGWLTVVAILAAAPISPTWTRAVRGYVHSLLQRAEAAAQCLVIVEARRLASGGAVSSVRRVAESPLAGADEPPTWAALRARLLALRCLLRNLPRRARRLLRWVAGETGGGACHVRECREALVAVSQCPLPAPWHPPEPA